MSSTKEKAKELVDKFKKYCDIDDPNGILDWEECVKYNAKNCALIAVDECLKCCIGSHVKFWKEVKEEINKL